MEKKHDRADGKTSMTISLPKELLERIDAAAKKDKRPRSNWVVLKLEQALNRPKLDAAQPHAVVLSAAIEPRSDSMPLLAAEKPGATKPEPAATPSGKPVSYRAGRKEKRRS